MKKLILSLLLLCSLSMAAEQTTRSEQKQQYLEQVKQGLGPRHSLELGIGDPLTCEMQGIFYACKSSHYLDYQPVMKGDLWTGNAVLRYYRGGYYLPPLTLQYHYTIRHWLLVGVNATYFSFGQHYYDARNGEKLATYSNHMLNFMADVRFQYFDRRNVGIYSSVALGAGIGIEKETHTQVGAAPAWQITAFGLRAGNRVYYMLELGWGVKGFGHMGIGCRF